VKKLWAADRDRVRLAGRIGDANSATQQDVVEPRRHAHRRAKEKTVRLERGRDLPRIERAIGARRSMSRRGDGALVGTAPVWAALAAVSNVAMDVKPSGCASLQPRSGHRSRQMSL